MAFKFCQLDLPKMTRVEFTLNGCLFQTFEAKYPCSLLLKMLKILITSNILSRDSVQNNLKSI